MQNDNNLKILRENSTRLKGIFYRQSFDKIPFITYCVEKSTIRSFHFAKGYVKIYKPLSIFRVWAFNFLSDKTNMDKLKARDNFILLRKSAIADLENYWTVIDGGTPEFYHFNKLIDLFFKFLPLWNSLDNKTKDWVFKNTNVPLDKFSLDLLGRWSPKSNILKGVSMNFVDKTNYNKFQKKIKGICKEIPVIIFDLYAWETSHQPKEKFELIEIDKKKTALNNVRVNH